MIYSKTPKVDLAPFGTKLFIYLCLIHNNNNVLHFYSTQLEHVWTGLKEDSYEIKIRGESLGHEGGGIWWEKIWGIPILTGSGSSTGFPSNTWEQRDGEFWGDRTTNDSHSCKHYLFDQG